MGTRNTRPRRVERKGRVMARVMVWRGLDEPRMEIARIESFTHADGTQIGTDYELRWRLDGTVLDVEVVGTVAKRIDLGEADFFDVQHSPFFNSLPVMRDGLLDAGPARDYTMRFVGLPELDHDLMRQQYEPRGGRIVRYRAGTFEADITFDADGFVTLYEDYLERVSP